MVKVTTLILNVHLLNRDKYDLDSGDCCKKNENVIKMELYRRFVSILYRITSFRRREISQFFLVCPEDHII